MNLLFLIVLGLVCGVGIAATIQDMRSRKVSNYITYPFLAVALGIFIYAIPFLLFLSFLALLTSVLIGYLFYHKGIWGAADGKLFIGLSMLLIAYKGSVMYSHFLINLLFIYSIVIMIISQISTTEKQKRQVFKKIRYLEILILLLIIFIPITVVLASFDPFFQTLEITLFLIVLFALFIFLTPQLRSILKKETVKQHVVLALLLMGIFLIIGNEIAFIYFILIYFAKLLIEYFSDLTEKIGTKKKKYHSPFAVFLFVAAFVTLLFDNSILIYVLSFF